MKKLASFILSAALIFSAVPVSAATIQSYGEAEPDSGSIVYEDPEVTVPSKHIKASSIPSSYDLRDKSRVTSVKDQGGYNFCWSFATMASLESNLITKGLASKSVDLSEAHLAYYGLNGKHTGNASIYGGRDTCYSSSGTTNYFVAAAALARGYGAVSESVFPYSSYGNEKYINESLMTKSAYELRDAVFVTSYIEDGKYDEEAFNTVKQLIMQNGAVASRMYFPELYEWESSFGSKKPNELETFYHVDPYEPIDYANHAITIVGWDDDFDDFRSDPQPPGPGAWIVKDSYGSELHGDGYFYASYYNTGISQFVSFSGQKNSGRQIYQYDGCGIGEMILRSETNFKGANTFTARTDLMLDQIMTFTPEANCQVTCKIILEKNGATPTTGKTLYTKTMTKKYAGYSRTDLGKTIGIPKGAKFTVTVRVKTPGGSYMVPFELQDADDPGVAFPAAVRSGQSYVYRDGKWSEVTKTTTMKTVSYDYEYTYRLYNAMVKAYGKKAGTKAQKIKVKTKRTVKKGKTIKLKAKRTKGKGTLVYKTSNARIATVTKNGKVKARKKGTVKITVYAQPTAKYKSAKKVVKVKVK